MRAMWRLDSSSDGADEARIESKSGARDRIATPKTVTLRAHPEFEMRIAKLHAGARDERRKDHEEDLRGRRNEASEEARAR
jgi:hypothetical protein